MARILATIAAFLFLLPAVGWAEEDPTWGLTQADQAAIRQVIKAQLLALGHDDGALAFSYATPSVQDQFGSSAIFLDRVKTTYPAVYQPRDIQFRELEATYDGPVQKVFLFGHDGEPVLVLYFMQKQEDGNWKINGCEIVPAPDIGI
jgi:hypothetical protein